MSSNNAYERLESPDGKARSESIILSDLEVVYI